MTLADTALITLPEAKNFIRLDAAYSTHIDAEYVGVGDGAETEFTLDNTPVTGSLKLYLNNSLLTETTHYSISGAAITFVVYPTLGYPITASYDYAASTDTFESYDDTLLETLINSATKKCEDYSGRAFIQRSITEYHEGNGGSQLRLGKAPVDSITSVSYMKIAGNTGDGFTYAWTLGNTPKTGTLTVYVDGTLLTVNVDYTLSDATVTFTTAPTDGAKIVFRYEVDMYVTSDYTEKLHIGRLSGTWYSDYKYKVVYTAGYGATRATAQAAVPDAVTAVLTAVANWYDNRLGVKTQAITGIGSVDYGDVLELPNISKALLSSLRRDLI